MFVRSRPRSNSNASDASVSSDWTSVSSGSSTEMYMLAAVPANIRQSRKRSIRDHADCPMDSQPDQPSTSNAHHNHTHNHHQQHHSNSINDSSSAQLPSTSSSQPNQPNSSSANNQPAIQIDAERLVPPQPNNDQRMESDFDESDDEFSIDLNNNEEDDDEDEQDPHSFDLSFIQLTAAQVNNEFNRRFANPRLTAHHLHVLNLSSNCLTHLPESLAQLTNLRSLDLSQNQLQRLDEPILSLKKLETLIVSNNQLNEQSLPKNMSLVMATSLKVLSLSGNQMHQIPDQVFELTSLRSLYLGGNQIAQLPRKIAQLTNLQNLYLGGNLLEEIPHEVGMLQQLQALSLCENRLRELPSSIAYLSNLKSLALHRNELTALPPDIVKLRSLYELSLRDNPLVVRFVRDMVYNPPTLLELAGRCIKLHKLPATNETVPVQLLGYLQTAQSCVNPNCKGVYFDTRVEQIKFVDFCGIYRLPLLQYLCSPCCTGTKPAYGINGNASSHHNNNHNNHSDLPQSRLRRVLLG